MQAVAALRGRSRVIAVAAVVLLSVPTVSALAAGGPLSMPTPIVAFGNYVNPASNDPHHLCFDNELIRPSSARATYGAPIPLTPSWCALSMLFSDWNRSGRMDLRVSNDEHYYLPTEGQEQLWRVRP